MVTVNNKATRKEQIMIERNLNAAGRRANVLFGAVELVDGLVRVLSLGFLHTRLCLIVTRWQVRRAFQNRRG